MIQLGAWDQENGSEAGVGKVGRGSSYLIYYIFESPFTSFQSLHKQGVIRDIMSILPIRVL